ncbi:hypothetical protein KGP36_07985 [Patescibacteria group bacterium]|nr:hypothetical protein [Patescibacteria group bacterium]
MSEEKGEVQPISKPLASTTVNETTPVIDTKIVPGPVSVPTQDISSKLQSKIDVLTTQDTSLKSQLASVENQLSSLQDNLAICQSNLIAARNTQSQSQTPIASITKPSNAMISLDSYNPKANTVTATYGQYLGLPILAFDISAYTNNQSLDFVSVNIASSGQGNIITASLYSGGSNPIARAVVSNGVATFTNIQSIPSLGTPSGPYNIFIVKVDVSGLKDVNSSESVSASVSKIRIIDSSGQDVNVSGTAVGNVITVTGDSVTSTLGP